VPTRSSDGRRRPEPESRSDRPGSGAPARGERSDRPRREDRSTGRPSRDDRSTARPSRDDRSTGRPSRSTAGRRAESSDSSRRRTPPGRDRSADFEKNLAGLPPIPEDANPDLLDRGVRAELRSLSKLNADAVGRYLVAAGQTIDTDPRRALTLARAARARAARVAAVREAVGIAAYHAEEWAEALTELRTARRISGDPRNLPLIADCERALGRPEQAARVLSDPDVRRLDAETRVELLIVVAGARRDVGQLDAALSVLARGGLAKDRPGPGAARLWYAYADALEAAGRADEAAAWFAASAARDPEGELDSAERAAALL
jgi:tetratricopeptide (TPR) repeat protein